MYAAWHIDKKKHSELKKGIKNENTELCNAIFYISKSILM